MERLRSIAVFAFVCSVLAESLPLYARQPL